MGIFIANLQNLKRYKYQGDDRLIVTKYFLKPYWWSNFVKIFPMSFAPNAVTLSGFGFILVNLLTVFYYDPYLKSGDVPDWTVLTYAAGLFLYQTFDACDGMQARRTGQSGPLGELFDHCVDALNTTFSLIIFASVTKMGYGWMFMISHFAILANFYLSTWEEYHTHTLYLSEFSGPVEGILMIVILYIVTFFSGAQFWLKPWVKFDLAEYLPFSILKLFEYLGFVSMDVVDGKLSTICLIDASTIYIFLGAFQLYFNIISAYNNVKKHYAADKKVDTLAESHHAIKGIFPFVLYYILIVGFTIISSPYLFTNSSSFLPFVLQIGVSMAFNVGRIIVSHLTLSEFPHNLPTIYIPLVQIVLFAVAKFLNVVRQEQIELANLVNVLTWLGLGASVGIHGCFITEIITEITGFLDIWVLTIKHPKGSKKE